MREGKPEVVEASSLAGAIPDTAKPLFVNNSTKKFKVYVDTSGPKPRLVYEPITPLGGGESTTKTSVNRTVKPEHNPSRKRNPV